MLRAYHELGQTPTYKYMCKKNGYPSAATYQKYFGSWNEALVAAGLDTFHIYTKEFLISELHRFVKEFNHIPAEHEMCSKNGYPNYDTYRVRFGSWNNALIEAGLTPNNIIHMYDESKHCSSCNNTQSSGWYYYDNKLICKTCYNKIWNINNPDKVKMIKHKYSSIRRGYGCIPLNKTNKYSHGHHLWLENCSDFVIFIPEFIHTLYQHNHNIIKSMTTINSMALDYWINEEFYKNLYEV